MINLEVGKIYVTNKGDRVKMVAKEGDFFIGVFLNTETNSTALDSHVDIFRLTECGTRWRSLYLNEIVDIYRTPLYGIAFKNNYGRYIAEVFHDLASAQKRQDELAGHTSALFEVEV